MTRIEFRSIPKDEWEAGDYVECAECGAHLRHYVVSGGAAFGRDCAARKWNLSKRELKNLAHEQKMHEWRMTVVEAYVERQETSDWSEWTEPNTTESTAIQSAAIDNGMDRTWHDGYLAYLLVHGQDAEYA